MFCLVGPWNKEQMPGTKQALSCNVWIQFLNFNSNECIIAIAKITKVT